MNGKLIDNFSQESDVTSLQDHFDTSFEVFLFICRFAINHLLWIHVCPASSFPDLLASCLAVLAARHDGIQLRLSLMTSQLFEHFEKKYICNHAKHKDLQ